MTKGLDILKSVLLVRLTDEFFTLRLAEKEAENVLLKAMIAVGRKLIEIKAALDRSDDKTAWMEWLARQRTEAGKKGLSALSDNTARNYMRLAEFVGKNPQTSVDFSKLKPSTLLPILTLPDNIVSDFAAHGVPTASGRRKALANATANDVQWAAKRARAEIATATGKTEGRSTKASAAKTAPVDFDSIVAWLEEHELTDAQEDEVVRAMMPDAATAAAAEADDGVESPISRYSVLGPFTRINGRYVLGAKLDAASAAQIVIDTLRRLLPTSEAAAKKDKTLKKGQKKLAKELVKTLWNSVVKWAAWE